VDVDVFARRALVPDEVRARARAKVEKLGRLAPVLERAEVRLSEDRDAPVASRLRCEVTMTGHGHTLRAHAVAQDLAEAVDRVVDKLEHQVERLKGKLVARSHPRRSRDAKGLGVAEDSRAAADEPEYGGEPEDETLDEGEADVGAQRER
jgi:putative sigma-54 modulation protein